MNKIHKKLIAVGDFEELSRTPGLTSKDIKKFIEKLHWYYVSVYQKLTSKDIKKFKNKLTWRFNSKYQKLSSKDIKKFKDKLDWGWVVNSRN